MVLIAFEALSTSLASRTFSEGPGYQGPVVFENLQSSRRTYTGWLLRAGALELASNMSQLFLVGPGGAGQDDLGNPKVSTSLE